MGSKILCEYDYLEEDSDQERGIDSSEDELDLILHGTPKQKRRLSRSLSEGSLDIVSSGDEFEREMEQELEETMKRHESQNQQSAALKPSADGPSTSAAATSDESRQYYDKVYFDSDDEDGEAATTDQKKSAKSRKRHLVQSNDDLFYDPQIDDENQKWVDNQRSCYYPSHLTKRTADSTETTTEENRSSESSEQPPTTRPERPQPKGPQPKGPKSDAILNCPACMTTLCLDCQRHELYPTQYRAMFVLSCEIVRSEQLRYKPGQRKKGRWKKKGRDEGPAEPSTSSEASGEGDEVYNPVRCAECNTEVAVLDRDEVYHFFNVLVGVA